MKDTTFIKYVLLGVGITLILSFLSIKFPLVLIIVSALILPFSFVYTQVYRKKMAMGVILTYIQTVALALLTIWVYRFFKWPPTILQVMLLYLQVITTFEALFIIFHYGFNSHRLKNYLHKEVFLLKVFQVLLALVGLLTAYNLIGFEISLIVCSILLLLIWIKISKELAYV